MTRSLERGPPFLEALPTFTIPFNLDDGKPISDFLGRNVPTGLDLPKGLEADGDMVDGLCVLALVTPRSGLLPEVSQMLKPKALRFWLETLFGDEMPLPTVRVFVVTASDLAASVRALETLNLDCDTILLIALRRGDGRSSSVSESNAEVSEEGS